MSSGLLLAVATPTMMRRMMVMRGMVGMRVLVAVMQAVRAMTKWTPKHLAVMQQAGNQG